MWFDIDKRTGFGTRYHLKMSKETKKPLSTHTHTSGKRMHIENTLIPYLFFYPSVVCVRSFFFVWSGFQTAPIAYQFSIHTHDTNVSFPSSFQNIHSSIKKKQQKTIYTQFERICDSFSSIYAELLLKMLSISSKSKCLKCVQWDSEHHAWIDHHISWNASSFWLSEDGNFSGCGGRWWCNWKGEENYHF